MPFCRRTSRKFPGEWICGDHWRMVPRPLKTLRTKLRARYRPKWEKAKAAYYAAPENSKARFLAHGAWVRIDERWNKTEDRLWKRMKAGAIERATGL